MNRIFFNIDINTYNKINLISKLFEIDNVLNITRMDDKNYKYIINIFTSSINFDEFKRIVEVILQLCELNINIYYIISEKKELKYLYENNKFNYK
tara:strand:+ start:6084 stop:6368 length:285 start_codon:yes stop_codon:yes gene_type:complete